jgi:hypothetical protein
MKWLLFCVCLVAASDLEARVRKLELQLENVLIELKTATVTIADLRAKLSSVPPSRQDPPTLHTRETFSNATPVVPPLDSSVVWARQHNEDGTAETHEMLSLIYNETGVNSFPWPVYIQLSTVHEHGDACGTYVRMLKNGGNGWAASYHTDLISGPTAGGVNIGTNIEITNPSPKLRAIGVNIQQEDQYADAAINVQNNEDKASGPWNYGIHFDVNSHGKKAIQVDGTWSAGLDVGSNDIFMDAGTRLFFASGEKVALRYNSESKQLEILAGDTLVAFFTCRPFVAPTQTLMRQHALFATNPLSH